MDIQISVPYEAVLELVDHLTPEQKAELLRKLLGNLEPSELSAEDKIRLFKSAQISFAPGRRF